MADYPVWCHCWMCVTKRFNWIRTSYDYSYLMDLCYFIASGPGLGLLLLVHLEETRSYFVHSNLNRDVDCFDVRRSATRKYHSCNHCDVTTICWAVRQRNLISGL